PAAAQRQWPPGRPAPLLELRPPPGRLPRRRRPYIPRPEIDHASETLPPQNPIDSFRSVLGGIVLSPGGPENVHDAVVCLVTRVRKDRTVALQHRNGSSARMRDTRLNWQPDCRDGC